MDKDQLARLMRDNPDLSIDADAMVVGEYTLETNSEAEQEFYTHWKEQGGPDLIHDSVEPVDGRKFRLDFAHLPTRTGIEIQGGVWMRQGHANPYRFEQDCEKFNLAQMAGWRVYLFTPQMVRRNPAILLPLIAHVKELSNGNTEHD